MLETVSFWPSDPLPTSPYVCYHILIYHLKELIRTFATPPDLSHHHPYCYISGSGPSAEINVDPNGHALMELRAIGDLVTGEVWWRDRYSDIESLGYRLRSRYDPNWQPSWKASGQDFFTAEDGLATIVSNSILCLVLPAQTTFFSHEMPWTLCE